MTDAVTGAADAAGYTAGSNAQACFRCVNETVTIVTTPTTLCILASEGNIPMAATDDKQVRSVDPYL